MEDSRVIEELKFIVNWHETQGAQYQVHCGDCTHQPQPCEKCRHKRYAEAATQAIDMVKENKLLKQFVKDTCDGMECLPECDSMAHAELCPVTNTREAWRQLQADNAQLKTSVIGVMKNNERLREGRDRALGEYDELIVETNRLRKLLSKGEVVLVGENEKLQAEVTKLKEELEAHRKAQYKPSYAEKELLAENDKLKALIHSIQLPEKLNTDPLMCGASGQDINRAFNQAIDLIQAELDRVKGEMR